MADELDFAAMAQEAAEAAAGKARRRVGGVGFLAPADTQGQRGFFPSRMPSVDVPEEGAPVGPVDAALMMVRSRYAIPAIVAGMLLESIDPARAGAMDKVVRQLTSRLASPEEIRRAAAGSAGMTQPELRKLYGELGLTGLPPSELVRGALMPQPAEVIEAAKRLKLEDRAALDRLTKAQREKFKAGENIPGFMLPSQEAAEAGKQAFAPTKREVTRAEKEFDKLMQEGRAPSVFDLSVENLQRMPQVPQFPLPRVDPKITERIEPAFAGGGGLRRIERAYERAGPRAPWWYNIQEPLSTFPQILGPERGAQAATAQLDALAGTSMVNPISSNVRSSSDYLGRIMRGEPLPQVVSIQDPVTGKTVSALAGGPPPGYGAKAQQQHATRVREYIGNEPDPVSNPKPFSYRQNLGGNYDPRTVDTHDIRNMVGMPHALEAFGEDAAMLPGEYSALERLGGRAAQRAGVPQAVQQGGTWIGGADYTKLKSIPIPLADELNRRVHVTAMVRGTTPEQAWVDHVTGRRALLGLGGAAVAVPEWLETALPPAPPVVDIR